MRKVIVRDTAYSDISEIWEFYERQEFGAGDYFSANAGTVVDSLEVFHGIHPNRNGLFRALIPKFHHAVFYREHADHTEVIAVLDLRRDPKWIRRQLRTR